MKVFKVILLYLIVINTFFYQEGAEKGKFPKIKARGEIEFGIDSWERRYYRPRFRFDFHHSFATYFLDVLFYQQMDGRIQGGIDYWIMLGMQKKIGRADNWIEFRLNHMCRHISSRENSPIFDLNEVLARVWLEKPNYRVGIGGGGYSGGSANYKNLFLFNLEFPGILNSEISLKGEIKLVDFNQVLHEAELSFNLTKSLDLFIRNTRVYELKNTTFMGLRIKSHGKMAQWLDSLKLITGIYPWYGRHKLKVIGKYRFALFKTGKRRLVVSLDFFAPIWRGETFLKTFFPEKMVYPVLVEYERKIKNSLYLTWYGKYRLNLPMDENEEFKADLATGMGLRNQPDFDQIIKKIKYECSLGYNFKHGIEMSAKGGMVFFRSKGFKGGADVTFTLNRKEFFGDFKLFANFGNEVAIRPFVGFEIAEFFNSQRPSENKFLLGFGLYKWYRD